MAKPKKKFSSQSLSQGVRKPSARIPLGLAILALSLGGVWWVVEKMNHLEPYLVTVTDTPAGSSLGSIDFSEVYLASPGTTLPFLQPGEELAEPQRQLSSALPAGSVVHEGLLHTPPPADTTVFTVTLDIGGAPWLVPGAQVEVWVAPQLDDQAFSVPVVVAPQATVTGVRVDEGFAADATRVTVDLMVGRRELPALIHARANDYSIQVSPEVAGGP